MKKFLLALPIGLAVWMSACTGTGSVGSDEGPLWGGGARSGHVSVTMPQRFKGVDIITIFVMGGIDKDNKLYNEVWRSTNAGISWLKLETSAEMWSPRAFAAGVAEKYSAAAADQGIWLFGGRIHNDAGADAVTDEVWKSKDGKTWVKVTVTINADAAGNLRSPGVFEARQMHAVVSFTNPAANGVTCFYAIGGALADKSPFGGAGVAAIDGRLWMGTLEGENIAKADFINAVNGMISKIAPSAVLIQVATAANGNAAPALFVIGGAADAAGTQLAANVVQFRFRITVANGLPDADLAAANTSVLANYTPRYGSSIYAASYNSKMINPPIYIVGGQGGLQKVTIATSVGGAALANALLAVAAAGADADVPAIGDRVFASLNYTGLSLILIGGQSAASGENIKFQSDIAVGSPAAAVAGMDWRKLSDVVAVAP